MKEDYFNIIAEKLEIEPRQVASTVGLFEGGATVPFISRYRKEKTGNLDEVQITAIKEQLDKLKELDKRRATILKSIDEQGKLTPDLRESLENAFTISGLEDIYLPYRPKKKTRASVARKRGLEPLAGVVMKQQELNIDARAEKYIGPEVPTIEDALQGARDIIAEWISENKRARNLVRTLFERKAFVKTKVAKGKEQEGEKYKDYFDWEEPLKRCPSHRMLAMRRGEAEGFLKLSIAPDTEEVIKELGNVFIKGVYEVSDHVEMAMKDSYKRLLLPSIENEYRAASKEKADEEAIRVFAENLRQLLLAPPLGQKRVLAIDPGFQSGCKLVCLDAQGNLKHNETIYPNPPQNDKKTASKKLASLVNSYKIEAICIGNGTASRETEAFIRKMKFDRDIQVFVVNEAGASVYSASKVARDEFPEYDVTVRGAVSIGRRLMDPLAELVKIEPKSIGVGQYQHDVDQAKLKTSLDMVVESSVNRVGVNLNTASKHLLQYVSGLGPQLAENIVLHRRKKGVFKNRKTLKEVPRMGARAFEQSAGFLRIPDAENPLDNSAVHPESYHIVNKMAADLNCSIIDLLKKEDLRKRIDIHQYVTAQFGVPTLKDIMNELEKPGRDPRAIIKVFEFSKDVHKMEDLQIGMTLPGIVTNITNFGAFVDVGIKQDGLVHISQLANKYISNPAEVVQLHQHVKVKVLSVDIARKRVQLSLKDVEQK